MKDWFFTFRNTIILCLVIQGLFAQEPPTNTIDTVQSAEVFLEEYTDEFQEAFFEGLKQKAIQNYDRAINYFLQCKRIEANNASVDHELAKIHLLRRAYSEAASYAKDAVVAEPDNYWYLYTYITTKEQLFFDLDEMKQTIPFDRLELRKSLALIFFQKKKYQEASNILAKLSPSPFTKKLNQSIQDSIIATSTKTTSSTTITPNTKEEDLLNDFKSQLSELLRIQKYQSVKVLASEAIESYPLQAIFYRFKGAALLGMGEPQEAISILKEGLDYLFDNNSLANAFYKTLGEAYTTLGDDGEAKKYFSKVKGGS
ncbi:MAG: hypothetical protein AAGF77_12295 [Bacteroidota bacterium]